MQFKKIGRIGRIRGVARVAIPLLVLSLAPLPVAALPLLSEVFYDAVGSDDGLSFVEIYGVPGTSLAGFSIEGVNGSNGSVTDTLVLAGEIPADGIFVVADAAGDGTSSVAFADLLLNFDFQNGPDSVVLRNAAGVVDAIGYGDFDPGEVFAGEGAPAPDVSAGSSLARRFADVDTGDNAADWGTLAAPTPGSAALLAVPEPSAGALLAAGVVGIAGRARRRRCPG